MGLDDVKALILPETPVFFSLKFYALLGFNAAIKSMFDFLHFGDGMRDRNQLRRGAATSQHQMQPFRFLATDKIGNFGSVKPWRKVDI